MQKDDEEEDGNVATKMAKKAEKEEKKEAECLGVAFNVYV